MQFALYKLKPASTSACEYWPNIITTRKPYVAIMGRSIRSLAADYADLTDSIRNPRHPRPKKVTLANRMATIRFTRNIQRHVECPAREIPGTTLRAVLDAYFSENEKARGYVLD